MPTVRFAAALVAVVAIHCFGVWLWPEFARSIDLFLVLTVLFARRGDTLAGLLGGLAAGLVHDVLGAGPFALHGFANTAVGYAVARLSQRLMVDRTSGVLLMTLLAAVVQRTILAGLTLALLPDPVLPGPRWTALLVTTTAVTAASFFAASRRLKGGLATRRRNRSKRLHFD